MSNQQTEADKAIGQTFDHEPNSAAGSPANRARQAAKQLRLAAADERVGELGEAYLLGLADSSEEIATRLPDDPHPDAGGEQA
jgi:hypothetical protein